MILVKQELIKLVGYMSSVPLVIRIVQFLFFLCSCFVYHCLSFYLFFSDIGLSVLFRFAINDYPNNTTDAASGAGSAYNSGSPEFTVSCL